METITEEENKQEIYFKGKFNTNVILEDKEYRGVRYIIGTGGAFPDLVIPFPENCALLIDDNDNSDDEGIYTKLSYNNEDIWLKYNAWAGSFRYKFYEPGDYVEDVKEGKKYTVDELHKFTISMIDQIVDKFYKRKEELDEEINK